MFAAYYLMLPRPLTDELERIRTEAGLPSICAGAVLDGKVVALEAVGFRRLGSPERATVDDRYHLGSDTKALTAALAALWVQRGKLTWDTPLDQVLPEAAGSAYRAVTPRMLVQHRAGFTGDTDLEGLARNVAPAAIRDTRMGYVRRLLAVPPSSPPGTAFEYSNAGYVVLGAALERIADRSWEAQLAQEFFGPLRLRSAGFGPTDGVGKDQPVGHVEEAGRLVPAPGLDNPPVLGPAGTVHMSVRDALKWIAFQADEGKRGGILKPESFAVLHTPPKGGDYAGGFVVAERAWAGGATLYHQGSNTANLQAMWIASKKRFGLVVSTNAYNAKASAAVDEVCALIIARYGPK